MNIKVKVSDKDREWIFEREEKYREALVKEVRRHQEEMQILQKRLDDYVNFWETNEKPIDHVFHGTYKEAKHGDFETRCVHHLFDEYVNVTTLNSQRTWVCKYCKEVPSIKYFNWGDSRYEQSFFCCDCDGAKANGRPYNKIKEE